MPPAQAATIAEILSADPSRRRALALVRALNLPDSWIAAGFIRNAIWDHLHGRAISPLSGDPHLGDPHLGDPHLGDIDVTWFDPDRTDPAEDQKLQAALARAEPSFNWSVKNQARMHIRNGDPPYFSAWDAMRYWPETATAVAARQTEHGGYEIAAPFGAEDLFALIVRPTPRFQTGKRQIHLDRVRTKRWLQTWPLLRCV